MSSVVINSMNIKSENKLAFLHDLYIATDWGERFAELVDEHVELPKKGRALYVAAGTGEHALALQKRAGASLDLLCVDESEDCLELARTKAIALSEKTEFQRENQSALSFGENQFDLVLGNASLVPPDDLQQMLAELVRVAAPGGTVACWMPTFSSFGEFFSIYWEALHNAGLEDRGHEVEHLITVLPTVSEVEGWAEQSGLKDVTSWTTIEEFDYESGEQFLNSPLITDFLLPNWLQPVPEGERERVVSELQQIIDEERHDGEFAFTLKATLVTGKKSRVQ